jgi:mannose-6-phosphate isomerase-like protein (cupin superfamily)
MQGKVVNMADAMRWEIPDAEPHHRYMGLMFERDITPTVNMSAGFVVLPPGQEQQKLSVHEGKEEIYFVVQGRGRFVLDDEVVDVSRGTAVYVSPGCRHRAINTGEEPMELFWVNTPPVFGAVGAYQDVVKNWNRVK